MAKILIPAPAAWPAFDTSLGIAQQLLNRGEHVKILTCSGNKTFCPANPFINKIVIGKLTCHLCKKVSKSKISRIKNSENLKISSLTEYEKITQSLDKVIFDEDIQRMSYSTLQTSIGQTKPVGSIKHMKLFTEIILQNRRTRDIADNLIIQSSTDEELIIFNGRLGGFSGFVQSARVNNRNFFCFEHPDSGYGAFIIANSVVHDPVAFAEQIYGYLDSSNHNSKTALEYGLDWLKKRKSGTSKDKNMKFSKKNTKDGIFFKEDLKKYERVFSFFVSSEYENEFMSDIIYYGYRSQISFIEDLLSKHLKNNEALIIRMHPNMINLDEAFRDEFYRVVESFNKRNVYLVKSHEKISSYKIMEISDVIFGFGSTTSIEAALMGKPVISLCNRPWSKFSFDYELNNLDNFRDLMKNIKAYHNQKVTANNAASFIFTLHNFFKKNALINDVKTDFFDFRRIHPWFRIVNYVYQKVK